MIIYTNLLPPGAVAFTAYPFIFIKKRFKGNKNILNDLLPHEMVHYERQKKWFIYGLGIGLILWFILYLFVLPFYWNPFRRKWETEAFMADGYTLEKIDEILSKPPYYLHPKGNNNA
jgi:hypothetical protein